MSNLSAEHREIHCARKKANDEAIHRLGLVCVKRTGQIRSIQLMKDGVVLFYEWSANPEEWIVINLHEKLEKFLKKYQENPSIPSAKREKF